MDRGREVGGDISADGVGQGNGLQGEDVGEGEFGDLREVEAVALKYLERMSANSVLVTFCGRLRDKHFSVPYRN